MQVSGICNGNESASKKCSPESPACSPSPRRRRSPLQGLNGLFGRHRRYEDLSISIQEHIEERTEELIDEGMPRPRAEQTARREFGNVTLLRERSREAWQWSGLESIFADIKFTLRRLRRSPGFAITVLLTLAIGIGANTAVFSVLNSVLIRPLPYPEP